MTPQDAQKRYGDFATDKQSSEDRPWLMQSAIDWLWTVDYNWHGNYTVLETGMGGSTVFFAERAYSVISFENNWEYFEATRNRLLERGLSNVHTIFDPNYPTAGLGELPDLDFAFVDGRGRVRSVIDALPRLRPGSWLMLDDAGRPRYGEAVRILDAACSARIDFRSPPWTPEYWTVAWRKK